MFGAWGHLQRTGMNAGLWRGNVRLGEKLEDLGKGKRILLKWTLKKQVGRHVLS